MQAEKLSISYDFDSFEGIEFSPNTYNIQKRDSTSWSTKSTTPSTNFSIKFPSSLLNTIEIKNSGTPMIEIEAYNKDSSGKIIEKTIGVPKTTLFNIQFLSNIDALSKTFNFKLNDIPDMKKKSFSYLSIKLSNPFHDKTPLKLGLAGLFIFGSKSYDKLGINLEIQSPIQPLKMLSPLPTEKTNKSLPPFLANNMSSLNTGKMMLFKERNKEEKKVELEEISSNKQNLVGKIESQSAMLKNTINRKDYFGNAPLQDKHGFFDNITKNTNSKQSNITTEKKNSLATPAKANEIKFDIPEKNFIQKKLDFKSIVKTNKKDAQIMEEIDEDTQIKWAIQESERIYKENKEQRTKEIERLNFLFYSNKEKKEEENQENPLKRKSDFSIERKTKILDQNNEEENSMFYLDETELCPSYLELERKVVVEEKGN